MPNLDDDEFDPVAAAMGDQTEDELRAEYGGEGSLGSDDEDEDEALGSIRELEESAENLKREREADDAVFQRQMAEAAKLSPEYREPHVDSDLEQAAVRIAANPALIEDMKGLLQKSIDERNQRVRAGTPGFDDMGDPVAPEVPFNVADLSSEDFSIFMAAASRGGADPMRRPAGYTASQWERVVDRALGKTL